MTQDVSEIGPLAGVLVHQSPIAGIPKDILYFRVPGERTYSGWERRLIPAMSKVVHENANGSGKERFRA